MRIVPLLPSSCAPGPWRAFPAVELAWDGALHPDWTRPVAGGPPVHALHLPDLPWGPGLGETALAALRPRLGADFLVLRAPLPQGRTGEAGLHGGAGRPAGGDPGPGPSSPCARPRARPPAWSERLRAARGEAVGFCWDAALGADLDCISDRLFCAVGEPGDDFRPIQRLGYRWNLAIPAADPDALLLAAADIARAFPPVLFPEEGA